MQSIAGVIQTMLICGTLLGVAFFVLLSMPQSQLRAFLLPIAGWVMAIFCGIYCISPIDIVPEAFLGPFGLVDDLGAVAAGLAAVGVAMTSGRS